LNFWVAFFCCKIPPKAWRRPTLSPPGNPSLRVLQSPMKLHFPPFITWPAKHPQSSFWRSRLSISSTIFSRGTCLCSHWFLAQFPPRFFWQGTDPVAEIQFLLVDPPRDHGPAPLKKGASSGPPISVACFPFKSTQDPLLTPRPFFFASFGSNRFFFPLSAAPRPRRSSTTFFFVIRCFVGVDLMVFPFEPS